MTDTQHREPLASFPPLPKLSSLSLPWPTDWQTTFGTPDDPRPIILEIGFGRGAFLLHLAQTCPDHHIIGLEISNQCLSAAEHGVQRLRLNNVRLVHSKAETALHHLFEANTISKIWVNFPDPWFKTGHHRRRLMQRDTLDAMVSRLQPGGEFFLATDIVEYAEAAAALLADTPGLTNQHPTPWASSQAGRVTTKYEAKAAREGRESYYFAYTRNHTPAPVVPVLTEVAMPHIVFHSSLSLDEIAARFEPLKRSDPARDLHIHISEAFTGERTHSILFETHIAEPTIEQHTGVVLMQRRGSDEAPDTRHEYVLQMTSFGHPRPTDGMHYAVAELGQWLLGLGESEGVVLNHKLLE